MTPDKPMDAVAAASIETDPASETVQMHRTTVRGRCVQCVSAACDALDDHQIDREIVIATGRRRKALGLADDAVEYVAPRPNYPGRLRELRRQRQDIA